MADHYRSLNPNKALIWRIVRYQAEALVYRYCPVSGLLGMICYTDELKNQIEQLLAEQNSPLKVYQRHNLYFS
jgi:ssDNA thymidine ADP-ribosyltransferase, DarT